MADPDQPSHNTKGHEPGVRVFPLGVRAVLGRAASGDKRRLSQSRAASCAEQVNVEEKHTTRPYRLPLRAWRNSAPLVGICTARLLPGLVKPHPRGKTRAQGSRISGN